MPSISKNEIKSIRGLHRKKGRSAECAFIVEGEKLVAESLKSDFQVIKTYVTARASNAHELEDAIEISEREMAQISALASPSPALAVLQTSAISEVGRYLEAPRLLVLDDISDPGNLGTIIRTADWFGIHKVLLSESCVDPFNPKVVQASMGSIFRVSVHQTELSSFLEAYKSQSHAVVYGAVLDGNRFDEVMEKQQKMRIALVIGSESHGISKAVLDQCDYGISIQRIGQAESLNAAIATSILLYELTKQPTPQSSER